MLKDFFTEQTKNAINKAIDDKLLGNLTKEDKINIVVETPKNTEFGDFAVNVSSLARFAKMAPPQIAQIIADKINIDNIKINVVSGFINFQLGTDFLNKIVLEILTKKNDYGKNNIGKAEKVILEYVSANPTGPFHIGHGRWAAMGSALANLMNFSGYNVYQEFYINDAGNQINNLGKSLHIRILQELGSDIDFPKDELEVKNYYTGDYLVPVAKKFVAENPEFISKNDTTIDSDKLKYIADFGKKELFNLQKNLLENFKVHFDNFYSELDLHKAGEVEKCVQALKDKDMLYEKENALWFKSSEFGDDQDRVLRKTDGSNTYLTADIAYHKNKIERGFSKLINIWGADHHGYVARIKASIEALGYNPDCLEVLLGQLVNLIINGEQTRMGKRKKMLTLADLIDEVGVDATRYWMILRSIDTTLDFDVDMAKSKTDENPVFYIQYAHARACSILRNLTEEKVDTENKKITPAIFETQELENIFNNSDLSTINYIWSDNDEKTAGSAKKLILKLEEFQSLIASATQNRAPYMICKYLQELAGTFHHFYSYSRVIVEDKNLMIARAILVKTVAIVIQTALNILGVNAPQRM